MAKSNVKVIGAGMGGLAVAIRLAVKGYAVEVFERNEGPGGKLSWFSQDGYAFDAGPSLFTQPANIEELFAFANEPVAEYFTYARVPIACRYFYENGTILNAYTDSEQFANELEEKLGENPLKVNQYLKEAGRAYDQIGTVFLDHSLHRWTTWLHPRLIGAISATRLRYILRSMHDHHQRSFRTPEVVQLFDRFATYNGSDPYRAPSMLSMIPHLEQNEGTFYPHGGMISITNALYRLAVKKGVQFQFSSFVQKIIHNGNAIQGIVVDGRQVPADKVISNMDVFYLYRDLLDDQHNTEKVMQRERSSSALIFYWGINRSFPELHLHNLFFTEDYRKEFNHLFSDTNSMHSDPTIYINITSKMEEGQAPAGCENWFVMINAPADRGQDWTTIRQQVRISVIQKLNRILGVDLEQHIQTERIMDPTGIQANTLSHMGSLYGTSSNSIWSAFLRHPNYTSRLKGLYFTGGSVHPGGGIPLCLKSAKIVAGLID